MIIILFSIAMNSVSKQVLINTIMITLILLINVQLVG